jgi:hypothetical protein
LSEEVVHSFAAVMKEFLPKVKIKFNSSLHIYLFVFYTEDPPTKSNW